MLLTHSSSFAISATSSHCFTSSTIENGNSGHFWAFFDSFWANHSSISLFAVSLSSSLSEPKRSISSSSLLLVAPKGQGQLAVTYQGGSLVISNSCPPSLAKSN
uniref:Uncharacterized protein n=1 Tax=Theropithecus gelada TaxID=9565 RepID=A0A8D2K981_THEGE